MQNKNERPSRGPREGGRDDDRADVSKEAAAPKSDDGATESSEG
jgi:hypothetical protein